MAFIPKFELTERVACKASIMIEGLTGNGKSGLALMLSYGLSGGFKEALTPEQQAEIWKKTFAVDTENKSLNLFVGLPGSWGTPYRKFMSFQLDDEIGYRPSNYLILRKEAINQHANVFIADSITHMWNAKGGVLDMVNEYKAAHPNEKDAYKVWGQKDIADEKQMIVDTMRHKDVHNIVTVRVKEKMDYQWNEEKKKNDIVSLGEQQIQQAELKYEPDLVLSMLSAGSPEGDPPKVKVSKSRYAIFKKNEEYDITPELCEQLRVYLEEGVDADELLEAQRQDYIEAVQTLLEAKPVLKTIWVELRKQAGYPDTALTDLPLAVIKQLYIKITTD